MKLIHNWRTVLWRAWSLRLIYALAILSGLEVAFVAFNDAPPIPRGWFALLSLLTTCAATFLRLIPQHELSGDPE